jgi:hypothetical protein
VPNHPKMHRRLLEPRKLVDWESARSTWALAGTTAAGVVSLVDSGQAVEAVGLAASEQVTEAVGLADSEHAAIGSADFKLEGSPPLLLIRA